MDKTATEVLLKKADDAMYLAKKQGKNDYRMSTI
jgi:PleD family two-component response regulator